MNNTTAVIVALILAASVASSCAPNGAKPTPSPPPPPPPGATQRGPAPPVNRQAVHDAIVKARTFLLAGQQVDGTWKDPPGAEAGTTTVLVTWAVPMNRMNYFNDPRIVKARRLLTDLKTDSTRLLGLRAMLWQDASKYYGHEYISLLRKDVVQLINSTGTPGGHGPKTASKTADLVSSGFATRGVQAAEERRMEIPRLYWVRTLAYWLVAQNADGGWGDKAGGPSTIAMTATGIDIVQSCLDAAFYTVKIGQPPRPGDKAVARAQTWLDANFTKTLNAGQDLPQGNRI